MQRLPRKQKIGRPGKQRSQRTQRTLLRAAHGLPRTTSPSSPPKLRPSQPQNRILVASPHCPPYLLGLQPPRTGLASDQLVVVHLPKIPTVIIKFILPVYNHHFHHAFADVLAFSLVCFPTPTAYSHIFILPLLAFCAMRRIYPELLGILTQNEVRVMG